MPLPCSGGADQHRHGEALAQLAGEVVEDAVARRLDLLEQLLHQLIVMIGEALQHRVARFLLAQLVVGGNVDHARGGMLLVDEGALEREVDIADGDAVLPDRYLAQQKRHAGGGLQHRERVAHALSPRRRSC